MTLTSQNALLNCQIPRLAHMASKTLIILSEGRPIFVKRSSEWWHPCDTLDPKFKTQKPYKGSIPSERTTWDATQNLDAPLISAHYRRESLDSLSNYLTLHPRFDWVFRACQSALKKLQWTTRAVMESVQQKIQRLKMQAMLDPPLSPRVWEGSCDLQKFCFQDLVKEWKVPRTQSMVADCRVPKSASIRTPVKASVDPAEFEKLSFKDHIKDWKLPKQQSTASTRRRWVPKRATSKTPLVMPASPTIRSSKLIHRQNEPV